MAKPSGGKREKIGTRGGGSYKEKLELGYGLFLFEGFYDGEL